ncbi:MAG: hypothetical protein II400_08375, partial [Bacteroidaceae bacterium]|nr:hypothetical protein [Bacteroidaceae bacterium]
STTTLFNWDWWQFNEFTSAIEAVPESTRSASSVIYNLQGIPVKSPTKGIYIKNGKKLSIK